ncbi:glycosyltransferase family 4 protein [Zavarzinella formosa]|uniref:glycosyltransferase family 4 protein n=1 Tax=Zavarzinella formosa TaxID=360055 RepID=UPI000303D421|nr:glycosyltransferase family 4 protein [Zavarzinella formosa]
MRVGLCYESVIPARGGCEHYITDLSRKLSRDGHQVHLFACRWDASALPADTVYHQLPSPGGLRFRRPWRFGQSCVEALVSTPVDVSMGFDKTWGQDILYPQGGLHSASREHSLYKHPPGLVRSLARALRIFDATTYSYDHLERQLYLGPDKPVILVNSRMVQRHFQQYRGLGPDRVRVLYSAIDPERFAADDREARRIAERQSWNVADDIPVGLFIAMNYRLKGLSPLLHSLKHIPADVRFRLAVVGNAKYQQYEQLAVKLGVRDRVIFLGFRANPKEAYFASDFLIHPTFYDPGSLVALEALACGLPVVTTRYNGNSELLTPGENGLVIDDPHNHQALGTAIAEMADPVKLPARKQSAFAAGRRWTFDDHYRELLAILQEVADRKRQSAGVP